MLLFLLALAQTFVTEPYLQLGARPAPDRLSVVWHAPGASANWWAEHETPGGWRPAAKVTARRAAIGSKSPFLIYEAELDGLKPGAVFRYRVRRNEQIVFTHEAKALPAVDAPASLAIVGDTGQLTRGQRAVAEQMKKANPGAVFAVGDIVYPSGRLKYYAERWFGVMQPLLAGRVSAAAPGNHDVEECLNLDAKPDGLAYFYLWRHPENGPSGTAIPAKGRTDALRQAAGTAYPSAASYAFEYGPLHVTVLDSNHYMDWTGAALQRWLEQGWAATRRPWRIVMLHHAPFHSTRKHAEQQRMRVLAPLFEKHKVAIVFSGHVHNYQRSHPLRFAPANATHPLGDRQRIEGKAIRDEKNGVYYIVTGAGGAGLHDAGSSANPLRWQEFTAKFEAREHSFTWLEATSTQLAIRQISASGRELDSLNLPRK